MKYQLLKLKYKWLELLKIKVIDFLLFKIDVKFQESSAKSGIYEAVADPGIF